MIKKSHTCPFALYIAVRKSGSSEVGKSGRSRDRRFGKDTVSYMEVRNKHPYVSLKITVVTGGVTNYPVCSKLWF